MSGKSINNERKPTFQEIDTKSLGQNWRKALRMQFHGTHPAESRGEKIAALEERELRATRDEFGVRIRGLR
jgi:hypothetical protein